MPNSGYSFSVTFMYFFLVRETLRVWKLNSFFLNVLVLRYMCRQSWRKGTLHMIKGIVFFVWTRLQQVARLSMRQTPKSVEGPPTKQHHHFHFVNTQEDQVMSPACSSKLHCNLRGSTEWDLNPGLCFQSDILTTTLYLFLWDAVMVVSTEVNPAPFYFWFQQFPNWW